MKTITVDGLVIPKGTVEYEWWEKNHDKIEGHRSNPPRIDPTHPHAPKSHPLRPGHHKRPAHHPTFDELVCAYAHESLGDAGKLIYTEGPLRSELFHRMGGEFAGAHADCSQYGASILHWLGVKTVTDRDFTGTLWPKGHVLARPVAGCGIIWGAYPGVHFAFYTGGGYCVGFGHQGAPDRTTLADMNTYFQSVGHPGIRYLKFTA